MLFHIAEVRAKPITQEQTTLIAKAADFLEKQGDLKNASLANYYVVRAYNLQSDVEQELTHYFDAYAYVESAKDSLMIGKSLYNIDVMYADEKVFDSTTVCLQKAIPLLREGDLLTYTICYMALFIKEHQNQKKR